MCGILGLINIGSKESLCKGLSVMEHRGPDDEGILWFEDSNSGIGNRRLAILDITSEGHQPMVNFNGNLSITFNGEIYNYNELRNHLEKEGFSFHSKTDTEVVLYAFEKWGIKCLDKFNGMFAFAIWNNTKRELFLARDRIGIKPLYYWYENNKLIFASEIKAILATKLIKVEPDYEALYNPTRYLISPYTGFKDIYKLEPGTYILFKNFGFTKKKYWNIKLNEKNINLNDAILTLDLLLTDAVKKQMIADVPIGILLSGGVDSSLISVLASRNTTKKLHSFTIKYNEKDQKIEKLSRDDYYSKLIADGLDFSHTEIELNTKIIELFPKVIYHLDEPLADPAAINTFLISKIAQEKGIKVLLNGMGGDEIFGGYRKHLASLLADIYIKYSPKIVRKIIFQFVQKLPEHSGPSGYKKVRWLKRFLNLSLYNQFERILIGDLSLSKEIFSEIYTRDYHNTYYYTYLQKIFDVDVNYLTKMCLVDTNIFLPEHNLTYLDKATMMASVEGRPPLTDHRIVEFMFSLEPNFRIKFLTQKYLLKKVAEKYLPKEVVYRPKAPFAVPLRSWIKDDLQEFIKDILLGKETKERGLYNIDAVNRIIEDNNTGKSDNSLIIWQLLTVEMWFRTFFN